MLNPCKTETHTETLIVIILEEWDKDFVSYFYTFIKFSTVNTNSFYY